MFEAQNSISSLTEVAPERQLNLIGFKINDLICKAGSSIDALTTINERLFSTAPRTGENSPDCPLEPGTIGLLKDHLNQLERSLNEIAYQISLLQDL